MQHLGRHSLALLALAIAITPTLSFGQALPGTLDPNFGTGGRKTTNFGGAGDLARSVAVQADGKIVAAGIATIGGGSDFALARYNSNGTLDASFGTGGKVTTDFAGSFDGAFSVAVQADGKIVAAGLAVIRSFSDFALARYNSNGTLDTSFGTGGKVTTVFAGVSAQVSSVAVQTDGKIVVAGQANISGGYDFALARYNSNGTLDASFGTGGRRTTNFVGSQGFSVAQAFSVALQPDGKIVAAGQAFNSGGFDFALARYNSNGTLDASFGTGGRKITRFASSNDRAFSVRVQPDGKIVAAGVAILSGNPDFALARYNSNGTLDVSFGAGGKVTTDFARSTDAAFSIRIQPDGKIVAVGQAVISGGFDFALARYNSNGTLDASFGTGGKRTTNFAGDTDGAFSVAVQPDGKIVAAGQATINGGGDFALARYN